MITITKISVKSMYHVTRFLPCRNFSIKKLSTNKIISESQKYTASEIYVSTIYLIPQILTLVFYFAWKNVYL